MRSLVASLLLLAVSTAARAQDRGPDDPDRFRSPQHFALELRFGPYHPDIDSELTNGQRPYDSTFGTGSSFLFATEFDWQFFHGFGSLALGGSVGFLTESAAAFNADGSRSAGDQTGFRLIPLALLLVYRFDVLANRFHIPIVPYGKFGLIYDLWWITNGNGDVAGARGLDGSLGHALGGNFGYQWAVGGMLQLDWFERDAAVTMDTELGINHTYLFFEWFKATIDRAGALHVGDSTFTLGVAFEF